MACILEPFSKTNTLFFVVTYETMGGSRIFSKGVQIFKKKTSEFYGPFFWLTKLIFQALADYCTNTVFFKFFFAAGKILEKDSLLIQNGKTKKIWIKIKISLSKIMIQCTNFIENTTSANIELRMDKRRDQQNCFLLAL